jgi:ABC-2 type transport system permease protein
MIALSAVYAMWLREIKRFQHSKTRLFATLTQPVLLLVSLGYGLRSIYAKAEKADFLIFIAPGIVTMTLVLSTISSGGQVIWDRRFGSLKEALVAPVSRFSIVLGRTLGSATIGTIQGVLITVIAMIGGFRPISNIAVLPAILVMFLIATIFSAVGISISSKMNDIQGFQLVMNFIVMPMFFLSGAFYPMDHAPKALLWLAYFNPISYSVDALRYILIGVSSFSPAFDFTVLVAMLVLFLSLGSYLFAKVEN